ncbi:glycosyltransferase [Halostagnicola sp. A-GB9-2]|uniref:glycosyltransferase n=1 Tax=Halostagnicola sp. A-GB9-2 TaxID=3048066 RepID=UPI0024BFC4D5|nr:glycosyltransferase [Halostagnicola sp. A-GB9-2]MDJ1433115.1 glycosyltransferase [Halostagnicola sp. A-GB9-2]
MGNESGVIRPAESNINNQWPFTLKRYVMAITLIGIGLAILFAPIPHIGQPIYILYSSPLFLLLLLGWYFGRTGLATLAHYKHRKKSKISIDGDLGDRDATPSVSFLTPAYNEAKDIGSVVEAISNLDYDGDIETVVVDDGSEDGTWYVLKALEEVYPNLRVFTQENGGSASARNTALTKATNEIVISLDADTVLHSNSLKEIARHFTSDEIVAVGGNVSVENRDHWWAKAQIFDYALAMEIGRMFQSRLGYVLCLSGAFGAFRRETLIEAGGWTDHWLYSDDFEVSVRMHEYGKIRYTPSAQADTIVPTTFKGWFDQRKTWAQRGISVMLLHHKKQLNFKEGMIGIIGLPLRALLTSLIIIEVILFLLTIAIGPEPFFQSVGWVLAVGMFSMTGFCAIVVGILSVLIVNDQPIDYGGWVIAYLLIYRPLHGFVRLYGFGQAIWWEISSFGGSLRSNPTHYLQEKVLSKQKTVETAD